MHLFISAGEPSGDLHGANLVRSLKKLDPSIRFVGLGGDKMEAAGCRLLYPLAKHAVMGFIRVLAHVLKFMRVLKQSKKYFQDEKPDAVIVIDNPGFHWLLAKRAHAEGIPVYYFVPPQIWAWASWRVKKVRKWFQHVLSALPFEDEWYRSRGVKSHYIGHPYFDELATKKLNPAYLDEQRVQVGRVIALLPGSRMHEVTRNLPDILAAAAIVHRKCPSTRFLVASFNEAQAEVARGMIASLGIPIHVQVGRTPEIINLAEACIAVSGSVSLELMYHLKPSVIVYRAGWMLRQIGPYFIHCKHMSLVNLLADRELYPEFKTKNYKPDEVAQQVIEWLDHPEKAEEVRKALADLKAQVAIPGACDRAAKFLYEEIVKKNVRVAA
ncbi:MAG: lipid-A-disaccharide synthase [Planctomycetes bacterium]|nr:lipid-A-disaccharide synthase [Planctomycetota bacterium]